MYEIKVTFKNGMSLSWTAKNWNNACELQKELEKKYKNARSVKIWKLD